jgi:ATP-binding cassette, subfamily B, bacterial
VGLLHEAMVPEKTKPLPPNRREGLLRVVQYAPRALRLLWQASPVGTLLLVVCTVIMAVLPPAMAYVGKLIIDAIVAAKASTTPDGAPVMALVGVELLLVVGRHIIERGHRYITQDVGAALKRTLAKQVLDKALSLELRHFEDSALYDKMQNARREADTRPLALASDGLTLLQETLSLLSYTALVFAFAPWALLVLLVAAVPSFISELRFANEGFRIISWRAPEGRRLNYLEWILTRDSTVKEVKIFGLGDLVMGRYFALFDKAIAEDRSLAKRKLAMGLLWALLAACAFYGCYAFVATQAATTSMTLGDLSMALLSFRNGQQSLQTMLAAVRGMVEHALFMSNLFAYLEVETTGEKPRATAMTVPRSTRQHRIEFDDVTFQYPGAKEPVLSHLSLSVDAGQKIALVGENGAGKSTMMKLLLRLYEPTSGSIRYGGIDLRDFDAADLRRRFGVVLQDYVRYQLPLGENIGVGNVPLIDDTAAILEAAKKGGADDVIEKLGGLQAMLGGWFEEGKELSGGQWQRVALARGFMRDDAEVLLLDEPSASVDAQAEAELFARLKNLARDRTAFLDGAFGRRDLGVGERHHRGARQPRRSRCGRRQVREAV